LAEALKGEAVMNRLISKPSRLPQRVGTCILVALLGVGDALAQSTIGYDSVAEARKAVTAAPGTASRQQDGWLIVEDRAHKSFWSFVPDDHEAYPAAVKRTVVERDGGSFIDMKILCEASKAACDRLVESFKALNEQIGRKVEGKQ
jgi:hypothetical protein